MSFEEQLTQAFATLSERLRGEIDEEVQRRTAEAIAALPPPPPPVVHEPPPPAQPAGDPEAAQRLAAAFETIDRARSLTEVLDTLLSVAREDAPHADVWLMRGGDLHRWRSRDGDSAGDGTLPQIEDGLPLTVGGATVALLVAEPRTANDEPRTSNDEPRTSNDEPRTSNDEPRTTNDEPRTTNDERRTSNVAIVTRYAAKALESLTAFKTARALTEHARAPQAGSSAASAHEGAEEDVAARRYARLLVSEIKLYHEPAVVEGRRDRDLATRLGGEIAHARVLYDQRVPAHVRERADYFQDELVKTLANGDASLLEVRT